MWRTSKSLDENCNRLKCVLYVNYLNKCRVPVLGKDVIARQGSVDHELDFLGTGLEAILGVCERIKESVLSK